METNVHGPPLIGLDLVEPARLVDRLERTPSLRATLFTDQELAYCQGQAKPHLHLAARFCAKEAVVKALGIDGWDPQDVEIHSGGPDASVHLHGAVAQTAEQLDVTVSVSMTHIDGMAGAIAIASRVSPLSLSQATSEWTAATIDALHRQKSASYGAAWRKRGELLSILPNVFRKYDRLTYQLQSDESAQDGEDITETVVDLFVYLVKYQVFLEMPSDDLVDLADDDEGFLDRCSALFDAFLSTPRGNDQDDRLQLQSDLGRGMRQMETWSDALPDRAVRLKVVRSCGAIASKLIDTGS